MKRINSSFFILISAIVLSCNNRNQGCASGQVEGYLDSVYIVPSSGSKSSDSLRFLTFFIKVVNNNPEILVLNLERGHTNNVFYIQWDNRVIPLNIFQPRGGTRILPCGTQVFECILSHDITYSDRADNTGQLSSYSISKREPLIANFNSEYDNMVVKLNIDTTSIDVGLSENFIIREIKE